MIELPADDFHRVRPLFAPLMTSQMFCAGVLDGLYAGRVFVDDPQNPQSGFVAKDGIWWFLAGSSDHDEFNAALNAALFNRSISGERGWGGMLVCHPATWDAQMTRIFAPHIPITTQRLHYICQRLHSDWRAQVPAGYEIRFIDSSLLADGIEVHGAAASVLELRRDAAEPDQKALGFVAIHSGRIVASSVIDCIVSQGGDIGLFTDYEHRRRNLAYLTAAAVIEYALAHGLETVHWDCESYNFGSIRTAEKLGLQLSHAHTMYTLILNPVRHDLNRAWSHLDAGRYAQAMALCQEQIAAARPAPHPEYPYILARCHLADGQRDQAAQALTLAVQSGWDSLDEMQADFSVLVADVSWSALLEQVQKNALAG